MRPHEDDGCEPSAHTVGLIVSVGMFFFFPPHHFECSYSFQEKQTTHKSWNDDLRHDKETNSTCSMKPSTARHSLPSHEPP